MYKGLSHMDVPGFVIGMILDLIQMAGMLQ